MITRQQPAGPTSLGTLLGSYRYREASAGPRQLSSVLKDDGTVHTFAYDDAGRVTDDGGTLLTYNGLDQLVSAQLPSEANPVEHGYGYDGLRTFTRDPQGNEQYWFTPNLRQHDGLREHYIKLGSRIIAKITQEDDGLAQVDAGLADARVTTSPSGRGGSRYAQPAARPVAAALLTLCLLFFASAIVRRRGHARWARAVASTCIVALFALLLPACSWIGRSERPVWQHQTTTYFHYGFGAGPTLMTRQSGTVLEERRYEPFGQPIDASRETDRKNPKTRTGPIDHVTEPTNSLNKETDPTTGFSYHGARWMAPQTGRWLTPDPPVKGPDVKFMGEPWEMHPYQYVGQNPVIYWDPDGQDKAINVAKEFRDKGHGKPLFNHDFVRAGETWTPGRSRLLSTDLVPGQGEFILQTYGSMWTNRFTILKHGSIAFAAGGDLGDVGAAGSSLLILLFEPSWDSLSDLGWDTVGLLPLVPAFGTIARARRLAAAAKRGVKFGQASVKSAFAHGPFKGRTIGDVANGLRTGKISPDQLPIEFVVRNGERVALNNRSLTALRRAGVEPTKLINRTGVPQAEKLLDAHLRGAAPSDFIRVRGGPPGTSLTE